MLGVAEAKRQRVAHKPIARVAVLPQPPIADRKWGWLVWRVFAPFALAYFLSYLRQRIVRGYFVVDPARAAYSHSTSVSNR